MTAELRHTLKLNSECLILVEHLLLHVAGLVYFQGILLPLVKHGFFNCVHITFSPPTYELS